MKRDHYVNGHKFDLGWVGQIEQVNNGLVEYLIDNNVIPVISCIGTDKEGNLYNINGDNFASSIASSLKVDEFVLLTDVDGLMYDHKDPSTLIRNIDVNELTYLLKDGTISGGMIPKIESCIQTIKEGVKQVRIINGMKPELIKDMNQNNIGTVIKE